MKRIITIIILCFFSQINFVCGQGKASISGKIYDKQTGEVLINAVIYDNKNLSGTTTNELGYYSLIIDKIPSQIKVSYLGYATNEITIDTVKVIKDIYLTPTTETVDEIVVSSVLNNSLRSKSSSFLVSKKELLALPSLASETDLNLYLQLTPGVTFGGEGNSNLYVRGGGHDQNLFLLDGMPLYHVGHFGGFFSTFNSDIINSATLYKGGFPARFGDRLSSVLDVHTYNGDRYHFGGKATVGLLFSKVAVNGPIIKGKSSYYITARKNTLPIFRILTGEKIDCKFYDLNLKLNTDIGKTGKLFFSLYVGDDLFGFETGSDSTGLSKSNINWGNLAGSIRYNRIFSERLFGNFIIGYSKYYFNEYNLSFTDSSETQEYMKYENDFVSSISSNFLNISYQYKLNEKLNLRYGSDVFLNKFLPGSSSLLVVMPDISYVNDVYGYNNISSFELNLFGEFVFENIAGFSANIGLRPSYLYSEDHFFSIQPRVNINYSLLDVVQLNASYSKMNQPFHVLTSTGAGFTSDYRIPVMKNTPPSQSNQIAVGAKYQSPHGIECSLEGYIKNMSDLVMKKSGVRYSVDFQEWDKTIEAGGIGQAKGVEFLIRKNIGDFSGWIGFTYSSSVRQFKDFNNGNPFYFDYDRRYELNCSGTYVLNENISIGLVWMYAYGLPSNIPTSYWGDIENRIVFNYDGYNSTRLKPYHRLDLSLNLKGDKGDWNFSIMNLYYRKNTYYYNVYLSNNTPIIEEKSLYGIVIPSVSYTFNF